MLPSALYRAGDVRALDRLAIEAGGIPGIELMERAGLESYRVLRERWPAARRVAVVAGPGNNGGDGFVVARLAAGDGLTASVSLIGDPARLAGDARTAYRRMLEAVPHPAPLNEVPDGTGAGIDVIVDALFGTGLTREVSGPAAEAVRTINASPAPVLALDVPSGIHADTGRALGQAVRAAVTPTFIGLKQGCSPAKAAGARAKSCTGISVCPGTCSRGSRLPPGGWRSRIASDRSALAPATPTRGGSATCWWSVAIMVSPARRVSRPKPPAAPARGW